MNNYVPKTINDIVFGSKDTKDTIDLITSGKLKFPNSGKNGILLYGTWGSGKTTLAKLLPDAIEANKTGQQADVTCFDIFQGNNGAAIVSRIHGISRTLHCTGSHHYYILDEVDNLLDGAKHSLRSLMNNENDVFILTTNNLNKIERGVQSRCHVLQFNAAPPEMWLPLFKRILTDKGCPLPPDDALLPLIAAHNGDARNTVNEADMQAIKILELQGLKQATSGE